MVRGTGTFTSHKTRCLMGALALAMLAGPAIAERDPLIEGARLCTQQFPVQEQQNNIPTHLLAAISTTESGRWHDGLGMSVPWPWTINVDGKGYYFNSKAEAIAQVQNFQRQGHVSIDVGCMQVNLKHHAKAFANLNEAFEPSTNVAYAAKFLHDNYAELGDWIKATAAYHSRTQVYGQKYLAQIEKSWNQIVAKVSAARASQGGSGNGATRGGFDTAAIKPAKPLVVASTTKMRPIAETHNVRVIQVANTPRQDVLVIRAQPEVTAQAAPLKVADATPVATPVPDMMVKQAGDSVRRVSLDSGAPTAVPVGSGSKFVFAN